MAHLIQKLVSNQLIQPPSWLPDNLVYATIMGSIAYGTNEDYSDMDIYGVCIPPKDIVFPHLGGEIFGFDRQVKRFDQWQQHHVKDPSEEREYDFQVTSIVKFFRLLMENNPNIVDSIYTSESCVLHLTQIGGMIREKRDLFLHKGSWHKFQGYAHSQLHKMNSKSPEPDSKRAALREKHGFDVKFGMHVVRLSLECQMILEEGTIDLQRHRELLKSIRRGSWSQADIHRWFEEKQKYLEGLYQTSKLRHSPDEKAIKQLLLDCLEHHYGDLSKAVVTLDKDTVLLNRIKDLIRKHG